MSSQQPRLNANQVRHVLAVMKQVDSTLGIPLSNKDSSARWTIEAALRSADVSFSDLGGRRLEGYGKLEREAAKLVVRLSVELRRIVENGIFMLRQHS